MAATDRALRWTQQRHDPTASSARRSAPASISEDVAIYASAYDDYVQFLADSGFNLDVVFSTTEGRDLAIETSRPSVFREPIRIDRTTES